MAGFRLDLMWVRWQVGGFLFSEECVQNVVEVGLEVETHVETHIETHVGTCARVNV